MQKAFVLFAFGSLAVSLCGCGSSTPSTPQAGQSANTEAVAVNVEAPADAPPPEPVPIPAEECDSPEVAVRTFLETLRAGDDRKAVSLLTNRARVETHKRGMVVQPPGSPNSKYEISGAERKGDSASVASVWTDTTEAGETSYEVSWMVRLEPVGWRVSGLAAELVPGNGLQPLNFEDPDDMTRQLQMAEAALAEKEASTVATQSQEPAQPTQSTSLESSDKETFAPSTGARPGGATANRPSGSNSPNSLRR